MHRQMSKNAGTGAGAGSGHHACASCKHQRKRCSPDCILAPYFPSTRSRQFQAVHKVFGVSNVSKMIRSVRSHDERSRAAKSMVWEAEWRIKDPVSGSYGEYLRLRRELDMLSNAWSYQQTSTNTAAPHHHRHHHLNYNNNNNNATAVVNNVSANGIPARLHDEEDVERYVMGRAAGAMAYPLEEAADRGASTFSLLNQHKMITNQLQFCGSMNVKTTGDTWRGGFE